MHDTVYTCIKQYVCMYKAMHASQICIVCMHTGKIFIKLMHQLCIHAMHTKKEKMHEPGRFTFSKSNYGIYLSLGLLGDTKFSSFNFPVNLKSDSVHFVSFKIPH